MWDRIKRVVQSNMGRFREDPLAPRDARRELSALGENLTLVRTQMQMLEKDLIKLKSEEARLEAQIKLSLKGGEREAALRHAQALSRVREDKTKIERQLEATRKVCARVEGVQRQVDPSLLRAEDQLESAAEATLRRLEAGMGLESETGSSERPPAYSSDSSGPQPVAKTIGVDSGPVPKSVAGGDSGPQPAAKTIGSDPAPSLVGEEAPPAAGGKTIGEAPSRVQSESAKAEESTPAKSQENSDAVLDELERLSRLHEQGALTADEFQQAKRKLLGL